ncbi:amino acid transporter, putative [Perkinsus marinus ATCC 50983]|uniref:Amino acid transporter, putative n=1 Tax=Perkinsus marinus (strain ATCC 50983 / TXsc) TaxID=423536 RepID=C5L8C7_PERM5|nr:amino acid transporter, putative [Perkinsus marinus ATCC 50983]EER07014.1 amino acid transporter, putative [Perkinsus marinus ATCC 50983]|eukprot:XP_002775198.1 amino acid transporter, putative [Perkinsus marinus ATCC 50983]
MFPSEASSASSAEDIQNSELNKVATVASTMRSHHLLRVWSYVPDVAPIFYPDNVRRRQLSDSELLGTPIAKNITRRVRAYTADSINAVLKVEPVLDNPGDWMWWSPAEGTEGGNRGFVDRVEEQLEHGYIPEAPIVTVDDLQTEIGITPIEMIARREEFMEAGGIWSSIFNLTTATLGAGVLSLPYAFRSSGYLVASLCLLGCAILSNITIGYIQECMDVSRCQTFEKLAFSCSPNPVWGRRFALFTIISVITFCFGAAVGYLITIGQIGGSQ